MVNGQIRNIQMGLVKEDPAKCIAAMQENLRVTRELHNLSENAGEEEFREIEAGLHQIRAFVQDDALYLQRRVQSGARVLFEGAQCVMLDVNRGSVPFVTSSHTVAGYAYVGGDVSPNFHRYTFGIAKAIMSRVGNGSFASEYGGKASEEYCDKALSLGISRETESKESAELLLGSDNRLDVAKGLRILSGEYGTGTKRPRRIGHFDLVQLKNAVAQNAVDFIFLTKTDLLPNFKFTAQKKIPITVAYKTTAGKELPFSPVTEQVSAEILQVIEEFDTFDGPINNLRDFDSLPAELIKILTRIEQESGARILGVGVGPMRDEIVTDWGIMNN
jgi:adenylosuccinate synthase